MIGSTLLLGSLLLAAPADLTILVTPEPPPGLETGPDRIVVGRLFQALDRAAAHLAACGACVVTIDVAAGPQIGKGRVGQWTLPETVAPGATLRILGGWDPSFRARRPLERPTVLVVSERRAGPVFEVRGRRAALRELYLSGFAIDAGPGNRYDGRTGALLKGASSSWPLVAFGMISVQRLVIADNVFANAANGVGGPAVQAASKAAEVVVRNNLFVNNVRAWVVSGLPRTPTVGRYLLEGNTFLRNFPYNPDPDTSNPGTVEIGNRYTAARIELRGNLFAQNSGGAIFPQWDDAAGPPMVIEGNLFFQNGTLFHPRDPGTGALVGKFNGSGTHAVYSPRELEEEFSWSARGNVVLDPQFGPAARAAGAVAAGMTGDTGEAEGAAPDDEGDEDLGGGNGPASVRSAAIDGYAPRYPLSPEHLPFPRSAQAGRFGASPARVKAP